MSCWQSLSYSAFEPSTQSIASGWHRSAIFSTHRIRCLFVVGGIANSAVAKAVSVFIDDECFLSGIKSSPPQRDCQPQLSEDRTFQVVRPIDSHLRYARSARSKDAVRPVYLPPALAICGNDLHVRAR